MIVSVYTEIVIRAINGGLVESSEENLHNQKIETKRIPIPSLLFTGSSLNTLNMKVKICGLSDRVAK